MKKLTLLLLVIFCRAVYFISCRKPGNETYVEKKLVLPATPYDYATLNLDTAGNFKNFFDNSPADNAVTNNGATLGRVLFYDTKLSINNLVACATCHRQQFAFAD